MELAKRHYLTASFAADSPFRDWMLWVNDAEYPQSWVKPHVSTWREDLAVYESVLLHYMFAIEALVANSSEKVPAKSDLARRAANLVARNSRERKWIKDFLTVAYELRNSFAHGKEPENSELLFDLLKLRRICQRLISLTLALLANGSTEGVVGRLLSKTGDYSDEDRKLAIAARDQIYSLVRDSSPLEGHHEIEID